MPIEDVLRVEVWDDDPVDFDDKLGIVEISIKEEVAPAPNSTIEKVCPQTFPADRPLRFPSNSDFKLRQNCKMHDGITA